jgi:sec-independent protein translocase protein TatA
MGLSGISPMSLGIILLIVILIFGTKKLRGLGEDVGGGIAGIREGFGGDLGDAAEEIARTKKSLEELQERIKNPAPLGSSATELENTEWQSVD